MTVTGAAGVAANTSPTLGASVPASLTASNDPAPIGADADLRILGTSDVVYAGLNDALSTSRVGHDPVAISDILNDPARCTGASVAAPDSDSQRGGLLAAGADGSADMKGLAPWAHAEHGWKIS